MPRLVEIALFTEEVDRVVDFYQKFLGVEPEYRAASIAIFNFSGMHLLIHEKGEPSPGMPLNADHFAFGVRDLDEAARAVTGRGLKMELEPAKYEWGRSAYLRDPDGRMVELSETG
jgi:catechol 2,3-dioxygenase-like lactoylglutathione lyase family enzyme